MAKDRLQSRAARKFGLGSLAVEKSIGITQLLSAPPSSSASAPEGDTAPLEERPTGLMKWSFDDMIMEEVLPPGLVVVKDAAASAPQNVEGSTSLLVRVTAEAVPDGELEGVLTRLLPRHTPFHFLTPMDFAACTVRYVWVRADGPAVQRHLARQGIAVGGGAEDVAAAAHRVLTAGGEEVWIGPCHCIAVPAAAPHLPLHQLPHLRYTVVLRGLPGSLNSLLPRLESLQTRGFVNYGHAARHGMGALRAYNDGKALLQRDYVGFLQSYAGCLTEGTPHVARELPALLEALADGRATARDWREVAAGIELGLKQDGEALHNWARTGLYRPHHHQLQELVHRAADVAPCHHDAAQVIREAVPRRVLQEKLRVVSEVHFNALASLRLLRSRRVMVGDLVLVLGDPVAPQPMYRDVYEGMADHVHGVMTSSAHQDWVHLAQDAQRQWQRELVDGGLLRRVDSEAEARTHTLDQVVLPLLGRGGDDLPLPPGEMATALARELCVEGLCAMRTAPLAGYRHIVCTPSHFEAYVFDEQRGWDWAVGSHGLQKALYKDQEGFTRVRSPLMKATGGQHHIARRGVRGGHRDADTVRHHFGKPARRAGMTCVLRMDLPRGSPITSALREVCQLVTVSPSAIFHLLARK